jgi:hypothetical protein
VRSDETISYLNFRFHFINFIHLYSFFLTIFLLQSCNSSAKQSTNVVVHETIILVKEYQYNNPTTIPQFFQALILNHWKDYHQKDSTSFIEFCQTFQLSNKDTLIKQNFYTLQLLHDLFTCQNANNCSQSKVLDMPYFWHWVPNNPRHSIYFVKSNTLLKDTKPPIRFSKYNSFADIDRTPYLFLTDLLSEYPQYYNNDCDTFSSFGWCSEREMAFVALLKILGFEGKVVAQNNHSWSEFYVNFTNLESKMIHFKVIVDNTFDDLQWQQIKENEVYVWKNEFGKSTLAKWYNLKATSSQEINLISNHQVPNAAKQRIEKKLVKYLESHAE